MYEALIEQLSITKTKLIAVSKTKPNEAILNLYEKGHRDFGENKVQELVEKYESLPKDINWHFIGHLQTNKVKYIAPFVHLIHSVDSPKLLKEINKQGAKAERVLPCLLQFKVAAEETKYGFGFEEAIELLNSESYQTYKNIDIHGVMGMGTFTDNSDQVRKEFQTLAHYFQALKEKYFFGIPQFKEVSMGMSGDYAIAQEEGSTMVRVGSLLFGARVYNK